MSVKKIGDTVLTWDDEKAIRAINKATYATNETVAGKIESKAKNLCPTKTGELKASIKASPSKFGEEHGWIVSAYGSRKKFYATFVEIGTSKLSAQPYLRPAKNKAVPGYRADLKKALKMEGF